MRKMQYDYRSNSTIFTQTSSKNVPMNNIFQFNELSSFETPTLVLLKKPLCATLTKSIPITGAPVLYSTI